MGAMKKTSNAYCGKCKHSHVKGPTFDGCLYYLNTGQDRNCEVGWCDKFEPKKRRKKSSCTA